MTDKPSKTHTSFLRRLLVAYLIDLGHNTVPRIIEATGMPRRTAQDTIKALDEIEVRVEQYNRGEYRIVNWGAISRNWIKNNFTHVCSVLSYPYEHIYERNSMSYEQIIHDQALYCANVSLELAKELAVLNRQGNSAERAKKVKRLKSKLDANEVRKGSLRYIYKAAGREDLEDLMAGLTVITINDAITALHDPKGWREACQIAKQSPEVNYHVPEKELQQWRLKFMSAIQTHQG